MAIKTTRTPSRAQMAVRVQFSNLGSTYQAMSEFFDGAYAPKPHAVNDYNLFVKYNLDKVPVYLTLTEAEAKACVVAPYKISHGVIRPIKMEVQGNGLISSIRVPAGFSITEDVTTLGEVSKALLSMNSYIHEGDQVSIVHLSQEVFTSDMLPYVSFKFHEFTLDKKSSEVFSQLVPSSLFYVNGGYIGTDANAEEGGMAYVLSRRSAGKLLVSTQFITLTPGNTMYKKYSSEEKLDEAIKSYGTAKTRLLEPGNTRMDAEDVYFSVNQVLNNGTLIPKGDEELSVSIGDSIQIKGTKLTETELKASVMTNPTANPTIVNLSVIGTVVVTSAELITITATKNLLICYLSRADSGAIVYNFS